METAEQALQNTLLDMTIEKTRECPGEFPRVYHRECPGQTQMNYHLHNNFHLLCLKKSIGVLIYKKNQRLQINNKLLI